MSVKFTREDIQRAVAELNILEQLIQDLQSRIVTVEASILDHEKSLVLLDEMAKSPESMDVLMPIGGGGLVEATISVKNRVRVNVGHGVYIDSTLERGRGVIARRKEMLERARDQLVQNIQAYSQRAEQLRRLLGMVEAAIQRQRAKGSTE